ncbi:Zinc finger protein 862 [Frankliniella fusca]|uniref:Zinc finger protein 862 n=1 Tax=Frankliniella fusca TaxID=407009 RepID=A0AAE1GWB9_9NEOP|nr:Zinc finger protein 862 [Frankliniella fusca]
MASIEDPRFKGWLKKKVPNEPTRAWCSCCNKIFSAGKSEVEKHSKGDKHLKAVADIQTNKTLESIIDGPAQNHANNGKRAEIRLAAFFADNNVAFLAADQLLRVQKRAFPDSKIVQSMTLGHDKCSAIVKNVIASVETEELVRELRETGFSILLDESTDKGNDKAMCVVTIHISKQTGKPTLRLLELLDLDPKDCSAEKLWTAFTECLDRHQIPVTNVLGMASDSAAVFVGCNNSFWTRLKAVCPWAILLPCVCHSVAKVSKNACAKLPLHVEEHLRLVSTYMNDSPKRSSELREFQAFYEEKLKKMLKPSGTRWLVLQHCVDRYLELHKSLTAFFELRCFEDRDKRDKDAQKILHELKNPFTKAYLQFLNYALNVTNDFNALFQSRTSPECWETLSSLKPNSAHPEAVKQLERDRLAFRQKCLDFYVTAVQEIQKRLPLKDNVIQGMSFLDPGVLFAPSARSGPTGMSGIDAVVSQFKEKLELNITAVAHEWRRIPNIISGERREKWSSLAVEDMWAEIREMKDGFGDKMFPNLVKLAEVALVMPHSNAEWERVFSIVTDVKNKKRNRMGAECLSAICVSRSAFKAKGIDCVTFEVRKEHLMKHNNSMYNRDKQNNS